MNHNEGIAKNSIMYPRWYSSGNIETDEEWEHKLEKFLDSVPAKENNEIL